MVWSALSLRYTVLNIVGVSVSKLTRLCRDTQRVLVQDKCSGLELLICWGIGPGRVSRAVRLSQCSVLYTGLWSAGGRVFTVWRSVTRELQVVCALGPLLFSNIAASWFERVVASDVGVSSVTL